MKKPDIIFVVGNSRSGTTMMGRMLTLHDEIFTFNEVHFFEQLWSVKDVDRVITLDEGIILYARLLKNQRLGYLSNKSITECTNEAKVVLSKDFNAKYSHQIFELFLKNEAILKSKDIPCEQTPRNVLYIEEILELFPNAKILAMMRDPRDILLSQKGKWKRRSMGEEIFPLREVIRSWANYHPITISKIWKINCSIIQKFSKHASVLVVKFEDLVENPKEKMEHICSFLNIPYTSKMLSIPHIGSSHRQDIEMEKVGVSKTVAGNWNKGGLTKSEIYFCQQICKEGMLTFNYEAQLIKAGWMRISIDFFTFPFKLMLAFILNLNRMKNIGESLIRRFR